MNREEVRRDVGQLLWVGFEGTELPDALRVGIRAGEVGAAVIFARNVATAVSGAAADVEALVALTRALHGAADADPLLVAVDQEGGRVQRIAAPGVEWPPMLALDGPEDSRAEVLSERVGAAIGAELAGLGFDLDFAPVLDVLTNPSNPVIGDRAFSREPERAALRALAFARGLERSGVLACGKHFPGHGDTATDSHLQLPRIDHPLERIRAVELLPFRRAVAAGLPMLMTAHVVVTALDPERPATLSPAVIAGCLQGELGYRGLVVSDDLDMKAISDHYGAGQAAVEAIEAGCHALLACRDPDIQAAAWEALVARAESDGGFRERVGRAAVAVRELKRSHFARRGDVEPDPGTARRILARAEHRALADALRRA